MSPKRFKVMKEIFVNERDSHGELGFTGLLIPAGTVFELEEINPMPIDEPERITDGNFTV